MTSPRDTVLHALRQVTLIDPHTHINPHDPASHTLADLLGYHYYTELAHASGMPKDAIESPGLSPRELVERLVGGLAPLSNTAQFAWLVDICKRFYGFEADSVTPDNWETLYDQAETAMESADWPTEVLRRSNVSAVFLTNDFDDPLERFDTQTYIPCLRTDDLVFHLAKPEVRDRLRGASQIELTGSLESLRESLEQRFRHFVANGARACAISLPPDFSPGRVSDGRASTALQAILSQGTAADASHRAALAKRVFWTLAELCDHYGLPFDLMIGVNRDVYRDGVHQGRDLYDSRVSLIQYADLFNAFPQVKFPVSVLASVTNQELVSYAWIFPNVITNGHWWYSNTPTFIRRDAAARLEAVPRNKQIGYYSDAYKLEFIAPKFDMYRRVLADILVEDFILGRGWDEGQAIELGEQVLRGNVEQIFPDLGGKVAEPAITPSPAPAIVFDAPLASQESAVGEELTVSQEPLVGEELTDDDAADQRFNDELDGEWDDELKDVELAEVELDQDDSSEAAAALVTDPTTGELTWPTSETEPSLDDTEPSPFLLEEADETEEPRFAPPIPDDLLETIESDEPPSTDEDDPSIGRPPQ